MSERNLAHVERIVDVQPIPGADAIEVATVLGWKVVVKKGEFEVNSLACYVEIDSILPSDNPAFEFMKDRKYRVRTISLRKQVSQGILFPVSVLPKKNWKVGEDVTEILGITKYDPPEIDGENEQSKKQNILYKKLKNFVMRRPLLKKLFGGIFVDRNTAGGFPNWISKTDETRIQAMPWIYDVIKGLKMYVAIKMDGTSSTFGLKHGNYVVATRNTIVYSSRKANWISALLRPKKVKPGLQGSYIQMSDKYKIEEVLRAEFKRTGHEYTIQGETCGESIQKNKMGIKGKEMFVFNVFDATVGRYLNCKELENFCQRNNLKTVPIIATDMVFDGWGFDKFMEYSDSQKYGNGAQAEGIVIRPMEEMTWPKGGRMSFKVVSNKFLLKNNL